MLHEELTKVMEFFRCGAHYYEIFPIYNGAYPYEVRKKRSSFVPRISAFEDDVSRWSTTFSEAAGNFGFCVPNFKSK